MMDDDVEVLMLGTVKILRKFYCTLAVEWDEHRERSSFLQFVYRTPRPKDCSSGYAYTSSKSRSWLK